jgi:Ca2+-dependent lipid-binding protein
VTKVAERLLQQTLGEARYKELLEQSKSKGRKKRKAREQATPHGSGSHAGKKPKESDASSSSSSSSTTASPTKSSTITERANADGDNDDDVIEWEGPTSDGSNYFAQQPEIASSAKPELDAQVIEILRALGIDVDVYEPLLSRARPCC